MYPGENVKEMTLKAVIFLLKPHNSSPEKQISIERHLLCTQQNCQGHQKQGKSQKLSLPQGA
jgi:hypothetical protein